MANEFIARNGVIAQNDSQITGSLTVTNGITGSLFGTSSWATNAITANTASYILNATSASFAATGSYADNFTVKNTLTAQTLVVSVVSSSVVYSSGSNVFGNDLSNTQQFTGSLQVTGSNNYILNSLGIGTTALAPYGERLIIQGDASTSSAVLTTSANSGISTLSVNIDRGLQGGVNIIADKTNQLAKISTTNSDFWPMTFIVRGADGTLERMRIANTGALGVGATSLTGYNLRVSKNITGATTSYGIMSDGQIQSGVTANVYNFLSYPSTTGSAFTLTNLHHFNASQNAGLGAGSAVTNQFGFTVDSSLTAATNNYGFYGNIASATGRWNLYMNGSASNYMLGNTGIGILPSYKLDVQDSNIAGIANVSSFSVTGNGGAGRGVGVLLGAGGSANSVQVVRLVGYQETASSTANAASFAIQVANTSGTLTEYLRLNNSGSLGLGTTSLGGGSLWVSKNITGGYLTTSTVGAGIVSNGGIQSDVTLVAFGYATQLSTQAASFTLGGLQHYTARNVSIGSTSAITIQTGFNADNLTGATVNYGFRGNIAATTNAWNLYMEGTANNYLAGALGIGSTSLTAYNLRLQKNITGAVTSYAISSEGAVQSDVTTGAAYFSSLASTAATTFTLSNLYHFVANQAALGAGSTVTNQYGFFANSILTGATNNYGFYGNMSSGSAISWNLYMNGTAPNYMAGSLGIGSTSLTGRSLVVSKNMTGATGTNGIRNDGQIQSDATSTNAMYNSVASTAAASFTTAAIVHYYAQQGTFGAGSTVSAQYGFIAEGSLIGAGSNFGFYGNIPSGTNRWNLYMNGTANNYMAGALGIGSTSLTGYNLRISKNITGNADALGISIDSTIQSDVTTTAQIYKSNVNTAAAAFTLADLMHFWAQQGTIGSTSAVTRQYGFYVHSSLTGAGTNFGFYSNIAAGATNWNFYANGTANNYMAGSLGMGSTNLTGINLRIGKNMSGSTDAYGLLIDSTITSDVTANAYVFRSLPSITNASFTLSNLYHFSARQNNNFSGTPTVTNQYGFAVESNVTGSTNNYGFYGNIASGSGRWNLYMNGTANNYLAGKLVIGTTTVPGSTLGIANNTEFSINLANIGTGGLSWQIASTSNTFTAGAGKLIFTYDGLSVNSLLTLVQASNSVGINNNFPSYSLDVSGSIRAIPAGYSILLGGSASGPSIDFGTVANTTIFGTIQHKVGEFQFTSTTRPYNFYMNSTSSLYIGTNRFVGIGKTTPSASLDVSGSALITGSLDVSNGITGSLFGTASYALQAATASYFLTGSVTSASYAATSSYADNFTVANQLTATTLVVQTVSSSVVYSSGSNVFGNSLSNTQQFTGSVTITGSLGVNTTSVTRTLTVNGSIFAGGVTTYEKRYSSIDTTGVAVAGLSAGANGDSAVFTFICYGGLGYQRIVYSCRNESTTWRTSKTIDEGANALDVLASADGATITFTFRGRSALQQFRPSVIIEASGNSIDTTYL